jgi:hypothetical protein
MGGKENIIQTVQLFLSDADSSSTDLLWFFVGGVGVGAGSLMLVLALCGII